MLNEAHGGDNIHEDKVDNVSASLVPVWLVHGYRAARVSTVRLDMKVSKLDMKVRSNQKAGLPRRCAHDHHHA